MDRENFMDIVYSELHSDGDNNRANRIIDAADEYAADKNVGTKLNRESLDLARAIDGLTEWQKHVQTDSNINRDITVAIEALKAQLGTNLAEVGTDTISRQAAIDVLKQMRKDGNLIPWEGKKVFEAIRNLPSAQPERKECKEREQGKCPWYAG